MPIQIERTGSDFVVIRAMGTLAKEDYPLFTAQFERLVGGRGKLRVLFDMTELDGWTPKGVWEEAKFDLNHNGDINRLAVIGDEKWQHALIEVAKTFAAAEVHYFHAGETRRATDWLSS